jgi:hypothetical protein
MCSNWPRTLSKDVPPEVRKSVEAHFFGGESIFKIQRLETAGTSKGAVAAFSWTPQESEVESQEHQDNADIHCQPFPESEAGF